jgi:hypothetical protein
MADILKGRGYKIPKKMTKKQMEIIFRGSGTETEPENMTKTEMTNLIKDYGYNVPKNISVENLEKVVESGSGYKGRGTEPDTTKTDNMTKTEMTNLIKDYGYNVPKNISIENLEKVVESGSGHGMSGYGFYKLPYKFKKLSKRQIRKIMRGGGDPMAAMMAWGKKVGQDMHAWGRQAEADMNAWGRKVEADMNAWGRQAEARLRKFGNDMVTLFSDPNFQIRLLNAIAQMSGPLSIAFSFIPGVGQAISFAFTALNMGAELVAQQLQIKQDEKEAFKQYLVEEAQARAAAEASLKTLFEQKVQAFLEIMKATKLRKEALARELEIPLADVDDPVKVVAARAAKAQRELAAAEAVLAQLEAEEAAGAAAEVAEAQKNAFKAQQNERLKREGEELAKQKGIFYEDLHTARTPEQLREAQARYAAAQAVSSSNQENARLAALYGIPLADMNDPAKVRSARTLYSLKRKCGHFIGTNIIYGDDPDEDECAVLKGTPLIPR